MLEMLKGMRTTTRCVMVLLIAGYCFVEVVVTSIPMLYGKVVDSILAGDFPTMIVMVWCILAVLFVFFKRTLEYAFLMVRVKAYGEVVRSLLKRLYLADARFLAHSPEYSADTIAVRIDETLDAFDPTISVSFIQIVRIVAALGFILFLNSIVATATIVVAVLIPIAYWYANKWYLRHGERYMALKKDFLAYASEDISGKEEIENLGAFQYEEQVIAEKTGKMAKAYAKLSIVSFFNYFVLVDFSVFPMNYLFYFGQ